MPPDQKALWAAAVDQIPDGDIGFVYVAYPEGSRGWRPVGSDVPDFIERMAAVTPGEGVLVEGVALARFHLICVPRPKYAEIVAQLRRAKTTLTAHIQPGWGVAEFFPKRTNPAFV